MCIMSHGLLEVTGFIVLSTVHDRTHIVLIFKYLTCTMFVSSSVLTPPTVSAARSPHRINYLFGKD